MPFVYRTVIDTKASVAGLRSRRGRSFLHLNGDRILDLAARAGAAIDTFNTRDFVGAAAYGVPVLLPVEFLKQIGDLR